MNDFNKVSTLRERNYELQRQLADISNATVKKFTKKTPELPIVETRKKRISSGTPQSVADIASRDLAFQLKSTCIVPRYARTIKERSAQGVFKI